MASSKVMTSSNRRNSEFTVSSSRSRSRRASAFSSSSTNPPQPLSHSQQPSDPLNGNSNIHDLTPSTPSPASMTVDGILRNVYATHTSPESTLLDAQITLIDTPVPPPQPIETAGNGVSNVNSSSGRDIGSVGVAPQPSGKTVEEVWREIVAGRKEMKEEEPDEMMTLEDFLAKAGAVDVGGGEGEEEEDEVKMPQQPVGLSGGVYAFDPVPQSAFQVLDKVEGSIVGFGNGVDGVAGGGGGGGVRGKRGRAPVLEPLDKAAEQRQKRMIKNRESAARSRERKQAYQVELESLAVRLEEENEQLLREKEERSRERFKQLMEKVVPVVEKRRPPLFLRRVRSWQW